MLEGLAYDVRHALRGLVRDRVFTIVALLSIGLGVGANSAIFSLVDQALYRRLPVKNPEELVLLSWSKGYVGPGWGSGNLLSHPFFKDVQAQNQVFDGMFARHPTTALLSVEGTPEPVSTDIVSGSYFRVLGVGAALGRVLDESDDVTAGAHPVVVLSFDFWKNRLGGRDDIVGRTVLLNNYPMTVVGVAAAGFRGVDWGEVPSLFVPTMMKKQATPDFDWLADRRGAWLHVFGRLKPGVSVAQAAAGLQPWFKAMLVEDTRLPSWPAVTAEQRAGFLASSLEVLPAASGRSDLRRRLEQPLLVLLAATGLVLLLACLNVANLTLARAFARRRETALRMAVGASRGRIVRELLAQSGLLAVAGALLGLVLAPLVTSSLLSFLPNPVDLSTAVNPKVFSFALFAALSTGLLFGLLPALQASRTQPGFTLKEEASSVASGLGLRKVLVVGQITFALVLLIGAGLFVRTLSNLRMRGTGFSMTNLVVFGVNPGQSGYAQPRGRQVILDLLEATRSLPEVQSASLSTATLLGGGSWNQHLTIESDRRFTSERVVHIAAVSPGFFATLQAPLLEGRDFDGRDAREQGPGGIERSRFRSVVVNEALAKHYFGDKSPIGARLGLGDQPDTKAEIQIVGVVKTFSYRGIREDEDQLFLPFLESNIGAVNLYVRTTTPAATAFASLRAAARRVDSQVPVMALRTLEDQLDRSLSSERLLAILAAAFAVVAVLLAVVGLYGVTSFVVSRRTREIGIRMALGATSGSALWLVVRGTALLVAAGILLALPAVLGLGRLVQSQLFGVGATDATTIAAAAALLALAALAAAAVPARRAASLNPVEALRCE